MCLCVFPGCRLHFVSANITALMNISHVTVVRLKIYESVTNPSRNCTHTHTHLFSAHHYHNLILPINNSWSTQSYDSKSREKKHFIIQQWQQQLLQHIFVHKSHPSGFAWAASIVWHRCVVCDGNHFQASHCQPFNGSLQKKKVK